MTKPLTVLTAVLCSIAGVASTALHPPGVADAAQPEPRHARYAEQELSWGPCAFASQAEPEVAVQCAQLTVPRDWAAPEAGQELKVTVSRIVSTGDKKNYQGVLLTNPGGPGGQGSSLPVMIAGAEPALAAQYDLLGMDPRGTGQEGAGGDAALGVTCQVPTSRLPQGPLDARDRTAKSIARHQQTPKAIAEACQSVAEAPYITTWQTAHDMDLLRQVLGAPKLNYLGYSYGTWLGAKYASMFPATTGRMVLDSSIDFQGRLQADFEDFPRMGQRHAEKVFLPWLNRSLPKTFGTTPAEAKAAIERGRAKVADFELDANTYDSLLIGNGSRYSWPIILFLLALVIDGEVTAQQKLAAAPAGVRAALDAATQARFGRPFARVSAAMAIEAAAEPAPDYLKLPITRYAVACGDQPTKSAGWYKKLSDRQGPRFSYFGWLYGLIEECGPWSDLPRQTLPTLPVEVRDNILVVQGEFDPQTSYEQAMAGVRKAPGVDVLRVDDSAFHGQYAATANPCVDGVVNTYLLYGSKSDDALCPSVPLPGDTKVYPVRGPVDAAVGTALPAARSAVGAADAELRLALSERLSAVNR